MSFKALPGFRDFFPAEMAVRRHIEAAWHAAAQAAGFQEIDGPPLESTDLFKAKSGEAIVDELYAFQDKGGRDVSLRAEFTPTLARMAGAKANALPKPVKWYSVPQLFRYQRQQRGRLREHIQWNVDILGSSEPGADAEIVSVGLNALNRLGLGKDDVYVRVSHRAPIERRVTELGFKGAAAQNVLRLVDKEAWDKLEELGVKRDQWLSVDALRGELTPFLAACRDYGIEDYIEPDPTIVRGLAYYTGVVFEIFDRQKSMRAIAGGGRYDGLVSKLMDTDLPALGLGMGDVVLADLLQERGLLPATPPRLDAFVVSIGNDLQTAARRVVVHLRAQGLAAETPYTPVKLGKAFKLAEAAGARRIVLVGPEEWVKGEVRVKELATGEETNVAWEELT